MGKNKSNKNKPKGKQSKKRVNKTPRASAPTGLIKDVCSITDPFCYAAKNAKYPDGGVGLTVPYSQHTRLSLGPANAAGNVGILILPNAPCWYGVDSTVTTPGTCAFSTMSAMGPFPGTASGYRINSWGIRLRSTAPPLTASGLVRIRGLPNLVGTNLAAVHMSTYAAAFTEDIPLRKVDDTCIIGHRVGKEYTMFLNPGETMSSAQVTSWNTPGWGAISIYVDGGPVSTTSLDIEFITNFELLFDDGDSTQYFATDSKQQNVVVQQAQSYAARAVGNVISGGIKVVEKLVYNKAKQYLMTALGGPAGGALALTVD